MGPAGITALCLLAGMAALPVRAQPADREPRAPEIGGPVLLDETGRTSDARPTARDLAYDSRIRSSFASAEGFQGPLDGRWTLSAAGSGDLYSLQLVDRRNRLEGAWLDLRRKGSMGSSGLVDDIQRS